LGGFGVNDDESGLITFIRLTRPVFLLAAFLLYGLGAAIAHYLGRPLDVGLYISGQALVTLVQLTAQYLNEYFDAPIDNANKSRTYFTGGSGVLVPGSLARRIAMYAAVVCAAAYPIGRLGDRRNRRLGHRRGVSPVIRIRHPNRGDAPLAAHEHRPADSDSFRHADRVSNARLRHRRKV
jgi:hypothetical protein